MLKPILRFTYLLLVLELVGCGTENQARKPGDDARPPSWESFPIDLYVDPKLAEQRAGMYELAQAVQFWEDKAGRQLFNVKGAYTGAPFRITGEGAALTASLKAAPVNGIFFSTPWQNGSNVPASTGILNENGKIRRAVISVDPNSEFCSRECGLSSAKNFRKLMAHETGHMIGMKHKNSKNNIMNEAYQPTLDLRDAEIDWAELSDLLH